MFRSQSRADPPLTLAERLDRLNNTLQSLGQQVKDAVASAIGTAVAGAVRDGVRGLLGAAQEHDSYEDRPPWRREPSDPPGATPTSPPGTTRRTTTRPCPGVSQPRAIRTPTAGPTRWAWPSRPG